MRVGFLHDGGVEVIGAVFFFFNGASVVAFEGNSRRPVRFRVLVDGINADIVSVATLFVHIQCS